MYIAACDITIDGCRYAAGDELPADTPSGCLASCLRLGQVVSDDRPSSNPESPAADAGADDAADGGEPGSAEADKKPEKTADKKADKKAKK